MSTWDYLLAHRAEIGQWFAWHALLSALPVLLGLAVSLPLGWLAAARGRCYGPVTALAGLLYTIPSIALFVILPGLLGTSILSPVNVVVALTVYSVALLVRVVADGLRSVPEEVRQSALALGYRPLGRLVGVELPVAVPAIAAGLRVCTVSNVSLVSVAGLIGVPELGQLFTTGFQLFATEPIVLGLLGCLLLALIGDLLILALAAALTGWRRAASARGGVQ